MRILAFLFAVTFLSASAMAEGMCSYQTAKKADVVAATGEGGSAPQSTPAPRS